MTETTDAAVESEVLLVEQAADASGDERQEHALIAKLRHQRERHAQRPLAYRIGWAMAGFTLTFLGVAFLLLPGPAFAVIPAGLAMLALEFVWAERMLVKALHHAEAAKAKQTTRTEKILLGLAVALALAAAVSAALLWDIPVLPV